MATYLLVHGGNISTKTWNKLTVGRQIHTKVGQLGARCWDGAVAALKRHGHMVFAPTLLDDHTASLSGHVDHICTVIVKNDLRDVILVGHSYGGMVITGAASRLPDRIHRMVYLDAALPDPGQSLYDLLEQGLLGTTAIHPLMPEPSPPYVEKLKFRPGTVKSLKKTYILCKKSEFASVTRIAKEKVAAQKSRWTYTEMPSSHLPMADLPDEFNQFMLALAEQ